MKSMFTDGVKRVMQNAREECSRLGHNYIGYRTLTIRAYQRRQRESH